MVKTRDEIEVLLRLRAEGLDMAQRAADALRKAGIEADNLGDQLGEADREQKKFGQGAQSAEQSVTRLGTGIRTFALDVAKAAAGYLAFNTLMSGAGAAINMARPFEQGLAEVSTLIEGTAEQMDFLRERSKAMALDFGTSNADQIKGFYEILSAGVDDISQANEIMETANKLAVGGATDQTVAMDMLTTAVNSYASAGLTAAHAADVLFIGTALGKTNMDELGHSLGGLLPIANMVGVSFEEAVIAVSALTTVGIDTGTAVSGIRQAMVNVLKPTDEAAELAKKLGLEFNAAAIKSKGFQGFLEDVIEKTGGSSELLARLFSDVDGFKAVAALAGGAGEQLAKGMEQVATATGKTDEAFNKIANGLDHRLKVQLGELAQIGADIGAKLLTVLVPALTALNDVLDFLGDALPVVGGALAALVVPQVALFLVGLVEGMVSATAAAGGLAGAATILSRVLAALGGPVTVVLAAAGALAGYYMSSRDGITAVQSAVEGLSNATAEMSKTQAAIAKDEQLLVEAKLRLAKATEDTADSERTAAQVSVDSISRRVEGNKVLLAQLKEVQEARLAELRMERSRTENDYGVAAYEGFKETLLHSGKSREEVEEITNRLLDKAERNNRTLAQVFGPAVNGYVQAQRDLAEQAGQVFDRTTLGPNLSLALTQMDQTGNAYATAEGAVRDAEEAVAGLDGAMGKSVKTAEDVAEGLGGVAVASKDAEKAWDSLVGKYGGAQSEIASLMADLSVAQQRLAEAAQTPDANDDALAARIVAGLHEAIGAATDVEGRLKAMEEQFAAVAYAAEQMGFDKNGEMRTQLEAFKKTLEDARANVANLNNESLSKLENSLANLSVLAGGLPEKLRGAVSWLDDKLGTNFGGMATGVNEAFSRGITNYKSAAEAAEKGILDLIVHTESGGDYNATWSGFGDQRNLTSLTLRQLFDMQKRMLANPKNTANSSAAGRYQIVGSTLFGERFSGRKGDVGLFGELGLDMDMLYDEKLQDRLAMQLVRRRLPQGARGFKQEWEGLQSVPDELIYRALEVQSVPRVDPTKLREDEKLADEARREQERADKDAEREREAHARRQKEHQDRIAWQIEERAIKDRMRAAGATDEEIAAEVERARVANDAKRQEIDLNAKLADGTMTLAEANDVLAAAENRRLAMGPAMSRALGDAVAAMADADATAAQVVNSATGAFDGMFDQLARGQLTVSSLRETWGSAFQSMGAALMKFAFQAMVLQPIMERLRSTMGGAGGGGGGFLTAIAGVLGIGGGGGGGGVAAAPVAAAPMAASAALSSPTMAEPLATVSSARMAAPMQTVNVNPTVNVAYSGAPGAPAGKANGEQLGQALNQRIKDTVNEFMVEQQRNGGMFARNVNPYG